MRLATEWYGTLLLSGDRIIEQVLFPRDARAIADRLDQIAQGEVLEEERQLAAKAGASYDVAEDRLAKLPGAKIVPLSVAASANRAEGFGYPRSLLHQAGLLHAKAQERRALGRPDAHVIMGVDTLDDLTEAANLLSERLREWYGLHYPEATRAIERHEELAALISAHGNGEAIRKAKPELPENEMGGPLGAPEEAAVRAFARINSSLYAVRAEMEKYLETRTPEIAPNVTKLVGPPIAARLLKLAGGIRNLAKMPAGTIQTLGAEKALFRHLKEGAKPPKHGVILQHPLLHRAPRHHRGPFARILAAKIAIAARADAFTRGDVAAQLLIELDKDADEARRRSATRRAERGRPPRRGGDRR